MADLVPGTVVAQEGASLRVVTAGEALSALDLLYRKNDGKYWKASCDVDAVSAEVRAVALAAASADATVIVCVGGKVNPGVTLTAGKPFVASINPGKVADAADLSAGEYITPVGYSISTTVINFQFSPEGVAVA